MTGLIVIDESGDLGSAGSTYFTICSIVSPSSRVLLPAARLLPKGNLEKKFYNVAGSIRFSFEQDNDKYRSIIENKVSVARRY